MTQIVLVPPQSDMQERWPDEEVDTRAGATTSTRPSFRVMGGWRVVTVGTQKQGARFFTSAPRARMVNLCPASKKLCFSRSTSSVTGGAKETVFVVPSFKSFAVLIRE